MIQRGTVCVLRQAWIDGVCEEEFLKNKFFEYKADFAAKGCTEEEAEKAAAEALLQLADALDKLEMFE